MIVADRYLFHDLWVCQAYGQHEIKHTNDYVLQSHVMERVRLTPESY